MPQCYGGHLAWTSEVGTAVAFLSVMSVDTEKSSQKHGSSSGDTNEKDGPCKYKAMRFLVIIIGTERQSVSLLLTYTLL